MKRSSSIKPRLHMQFFPHDGNTISRKYCTCSMLCAGNATSSEKLPKCCKLLNHGYTCNFLLAIAMQFQEIIALPFLVKNCLCIMSCPGNATSSERLPKILQTLNILAIYLSANLAIAPCSRVAILPRDDNAIISENCIAIAYEKLPV